MLSGSRRSDPAGTRRLQTFRPPTKGTSFPVTESHRLAEAADDVESPALANPPTRVSPLILDVDGSGLPLLGLEPKPISARLRIVSFGTRAGEAVDFLGDNLVPTARGSLTALPFADDVFDAVAVAGTLEHIVADDDALDELTRVLQPGGLLFLRVPRDDFLTWLDAQNLYTYIAGTIGSVLPLAGRPALRFRRHYGREELSNELAKRGLKARIVTTEGWGGGEILLLGTLLSCRWLLKSPPLEQRVRKALEPILRGERRLRAGRFGRDISVVAEEARTKRNRFLPRTSGETGRSGILGKQRLFFSRLVKIGAAPGQEGAGFGVRDALPAEHMPDELQPRLRTPAARPRQPPAARR